MEYELSQVMGTSFVLLLFSYFVSSLACLYTDFVKSCCRAHRFCLTVLVWHLVFLPLHFCSPFKPLILLLRLSSFLFCLHSFHFFDNVCQHFSLSHCFITHSPIPVCSASLLAHRHVQYLPSTEFYGSIWWTVFTVQKSSVFASACQSWKI